MASVMQKANTLKSALNTGSGLSFGAWQMLPGAYLSRTIARAGYDWLCIDCEHGNIAGKRTFSVFATLIHTRPWIFGIRIEHHANETSNTTDSEMHDSIQATASVGVSPIVRIPGNEGWMVKRALDAGAHGIIVPLLRTVEDARNLVQAAKFPPRGRRGFGSPFSMGAFDVKGDLSGLQYMENANDTLLTIVQIETQEALNAVRNKPHASERCPPQF